MEPTTESAGPCRARRRPRAVLLPLAVLLTLCGAALGALVWFYARRGHAFLETVWANPEHRLREPLAKLLRPSLEGTLVLADRAFGELVALVSASLVLLCVAYALAVLRPRWYVVCGVVLATWLGIETFAAPYLVYRFQLVHYELVRDPDHRPAGMSAAPGWNADGMRQDREPEDYAAEDFVIAILGDSFAQGFRLKKPHQTGFPALIERDLAAAFPEARIKVANFGWTSASPLLEARRLADQGARYHPDLVCLFVDMTDPLDEFWYRNLLERRGLAQLFEPLPLSIAMLKAVAPTGYRKLYAWSVGDGQPYQRYFHSERPLEETRELFAPLEAGIQRCADESAALGAEFRVFVYPRAFQYSALEAPADREQERVFSRHSVLGPYSSEPFRWVAEYAASVDFPVDSLFDDFASSDVHPHTFEDDTHWNEAGHRIAADAVLERLLPELSERLGR